MTPAQSLAIATGALLLIAAHRDNLGAVEDGSGLGVFDLSTLIDNTMTLYNIAAAAPAGVPADKAARNLNAFLGMLRQSEGTEFLPDPYRVVYGYGVTLKSLADHPTVTGEWRGVPLPDGVCEAAGFDPGCKSTAAGAYQIIGPTWRRLRAALSLPDFGRASQDAAAVELIRRRGALTDAQAGRLADAVRKCSAEWASLPGNYARQGQRSADYLADAFFTQGGILA
jgi:muramidase (phage lysozyme)